MSSYRPLPQDTTSSDEEEVYEPPPPSVPPHPVKLTEEESVVILDGDTTHSKRRQFFSFLPSRHSMGYIILSLLTLFLLLLITYAIYSFVANGNIDDHGGMFTSSSLSLSPSPSSSPSTSSSHSHLNSSLSISFSPSSSPPSSSFPSSSPPSSSPPSSSPPSSSSPSSSPPSSSSHSSPWPFTNWTYDIMGGVSELSCHLHDANNDGVLDVFAINITSRYGTNGFYGCPNTTTDQCMDKYGHSPCQVHLIALSGRDGSIVWDKWVEFAIFAANCREDLNGDGHKDCLFAGRMGAFVAMDTYNDALLWVVDSNATCPSFNFYYPLFVNDFDSDGIKDIVIINGGDSNYSDQDKERSPAILLVISGHTGRQISHRIHAPDQRESYSSPVLYSVPNTASKLILFGTGGETLSGSLWGIELNSLADHVTSFLSTTSSKQSSYEINKLYVHPNCLTKDELLATRPRRHYELYSSEKKEKWMSKCLHKSSLLPIWNVYSLCVYNLVPSGNNGVLIPPVMVDINKDNNMDLVVSLFNDHTLLFDGVSWNTIWDNYQPKTQTYSIPAPVYFTDDDVLDLIVRYNKGELMNYDYSYVGILDGRSGQLVETLLTCTRGNMVSSVVLRHKEKGSDGFMLIGSGCSDPRRQRERREGGGGGGGGGVRRGREGVTSTGTSNKICPTNRIKFEKEMCLIRHPRHEGEEEEEGEEGKEENNDDGNTMDTIPHGKQNLISVNVDLSGYIPSDLWEIRNTTDSFPNPWTDTNAFITDYCGYDITGMSTSVYFLTPQLAKEPLRPLIVYDPYVYKSPSVPYRKRRHLKQPTTAEILEDVKNKLTDRKAVRCSQILIPLYSSQSPAITDFNQDGSFEAVVSMTYSSIENLLNIPQLREPLHPPKVIVEAFNIQHKMEQVYGSSSKIDFNGFYSMSDQPWTQYMGTNGDGVFNDPN